MQTIIMMPIVRSFSFVAKSNQYVSYPCGCHLLLCTDFSGECVHDKIVTYTRKPSIALGNWGTRGGHIKRKQSPPVKGKKWELVFAFRCLFAWDMQIISRFLSAAEQFYQEQVYGKLRCLRRNVKCRIKIHWGFSFFSNIPKAFRE